MTADRESRQAWEGQARNWIAWTRTPGHDVFPIYWPAFVEEILPAAKGRTLEIGCGEGRVARELDARGHHAVALDASRSLVRAARETDGRSAYIVADGTSLPFTDESFQTVVAYNSLQAMANAEDMERTILEIGRVVRRKGHFCLCVAHPMTDLEFIKEASKDPGSVASYFENQRVNETVARNGLEMTFHGWTYTLEDYARALEQAGLVIERIREPRPDPQAGREPAERLRRLPLFLFMRGVKR